MKLKLRFEMIDWNWSFWRFILKVLLKIPFENWWKLKLLWKNWSWIVWNWLNLKLLWNIQLIVLKWFWSSEFLNEWGSLKWLMLLNNWNWIFERNGALTGLKLWSCLEIIGAALKCSQFCGIDLLKFLGFFESVDAMLFCFSVVRYFFDQSDNTLYQR